jgi:IS30 family transposase
MARPLRIEFPGAVYHITSRGNVRQAIFTDDEDRAIYDAYVRHGYTIKEIAGHLHFHYATISRAMKRVEGNKSNV